MENEDIGRQCMLTAEEIDERLHEDLYDWNIKDVDDRLWFATQAVYYQLGALLDAIRGRDQSDSEAKDKGREDGPGYTGHSSSATGTASNKNTGTEREQGRD